MTDKRGQLSIETLILYGLIVLVALSAVGALIYFDVLDLGGYLPDTCTIAGAGDLKCEEFRAKTGTDGEISLGVRNIGQKTIKELEIILRDEEETHFGDEISSYDDKLTNGDAGYADRGEKKEIPPGGIEKFVFPTDGLNSGATLRAEIKATYEYAGGIVEQESVGTLRIKVP